MIELGGDKVLASVSFALAAAEVAINGVSPTDESTIHAAQDAVVVVMKDPDFSPSNAVKLELLLALVNTKSQYTTAHLKEIYDILSNFQQDILEKNTANVHRSLVLLISLIDKVVMAAKQKGIEGHVPVNSLPGKGIDVLGLYVNTHEDCLRQEVTNRMDIYLAITKLVPCAYPSNLKEFHKVMNDAQDCILVPSPPIYIT